MREQLCAAFCDSLSITTVPAGIAVATGFQGVTGEPITFYLIGPNETAQWLIQDDGSNLPYVEAAGVDLSNSARRDALNDLLKEFSASYDEASGEVKVEGLNELEVPKASLRFIALLTRLHELLQTTKERVEAVWVEEAKRLLEEAVSGRAEIAFNVPVSDKLADWTPDVVLRSIDRAPVALYFGTSTNKAYEALLLHATARYQLKVSCIVVLLLENERALTLRLRQRADNSIVVPRFRGAEREAIGRIAEEALGDRPQQVMN